ncbi:MAG: RNA polymerase sigma factor [Bacteroidetes bacterium]|nr:MAG: RNA polymerase sigma factor [Bacteroidota bacterium]
MIQKNKQEEFSKILETVRESLTRFVMALTRSREDAKDLLQDTIMIAYENFEKIEKKKAFLSFLFTTASRLYRRRKIRTKIFGLFDQDYAESIECNDPSPECATDVSFLYQVLEKLPYKQKEALLLFELSGFSLQEIRQIQGGTLSSIKSRLQRGRNKLAHLMGANIVKEKGELDNKNGKTKKIETFNDLKYLDIKMEISNY